MSLTPQAHFSIAQIDWEKHVNREALNGDELAMVNEVAMMDLGDGKFVNGYKKFNIILGKNGSGKSTILRKIDSNFRGKPALVRYITPERGGNLLYDGNVETNKAQNSDWLVDRRGQNRFEQFRQTSVSEFRNLETLVLREIEQDRAIRESDLTFDEVIGKINLLLDKVSISRSDGAGFNILRKADALPANATEISSGESELISLSIEILAFAYLCKSARYKNEENWLLFDEPDVHIHPDLQDRLMSLLFEAVSGVNGRVIIATHSTSILASLADMTPELGVCFREAGDDVLTFLEATDVIRNLVPVFGAHPLSNVFNRKPPLIVEGEDDARVWEAAVRSSGGRIALHPVVAGNVQSMNGYEATANDVLGAVYENAVAFSLRDRDDVVGEIDDLGRVKRMRLACRAAENLIVTDDVLSVLGVAWEDLEQVLEKWLETSTDHVRFQDMLEFQRSGWDRRNTDLKTLRMLIVGLSGSQKPWEVAVGQAIANLPNSQFSGPNALDAFLGEKVVDVLSLR